jgi:C4-dicarboxylate transporter DctQ subunit
MVVATLPGHKKGRHMKTVVRFFSFLEDWLAGSLLLVGFGVLLLQVVLRYFTDIPTTWQDEVGRYCVVWGALIGSSVALRDGKHINVTLLYEHLPGWCQKLSTVITNVLLLVFFGIMIKYGASIVYQQYDLDIASTNGFKLWVIYLVLPVSGAMMMVQTVLNIINPPVVRDLMDEFK